MMELRCYKLLLFFKVCSRDSNLDEDTTASTINLSYKLFKRKL